MEARSQTLPAVLTAAPAAANSLRFERLSLPDDAERLPTGDPAIERLLQTLVAEAAGTLDQRVTVIAGFSNDRVVLLAPWLDQTIRLPVRFGEKVLWAAILPAVRLTPAAQVGVRTEADGLALLAWLRSAAPHRAVVLTDVDIESPLHAAVAHAASAGYRTTKGQAAKHLFHRFGTSYATFFNEIGSKYRNQLRKKEKTFAQRFGDDHVFREYRHPDDVREFLDAASAVSRKTYQYRLFGEAIENDEATVQAARRSAAAGLFRSYMLWHRETPICYVLGHQGADGCFEHRQTGYDPEWRDYAPGIISNVMLLQRLYEHDRPVVLDFGSGDSDYKRLFSNELRFSVNPILVPRRPRYYFAYWLHERSAAFNETMVRLLDRWGVKNWIKRRLRGAA